MTEVERSYWAGVLKSHGVTISSDWVAKFNGDFSHIHITLNGKATDADCSRVIAEVTANYPATSCLLQFDSSNGLILGTISIKRNEHIAQ